MDWAMITLTVLLLVNLWLNDRKQNTMNEKNIILFERYDGVRFVLERSLKKYRKNIEIISTNHKSEIKNMLNENEVDLLITELSKIHPAGMEISHYAKQIKPNLKIIWITVMGCHLFREQKENLGIFRCIEKPLSINNFRKDVLRALEIS